MPVGRPFAKGQSGNPSGLSREQRERLNDARSVALEVLMDKGKTGDGKTKDRELWEWGLNHEDPDIRVKVWFRAQDYAFGSPALNINHSGAVDLAYLIEPNRPQTRDEWLTAYAESQQAIANADQGITEAPN